ncbi:MAG: hypothetical protein ACKVJL_00715 [Dehalococcoidia bacterium]|jgi:hypothetical protein|tara:strand:- start:1712 stop:1867 length:156 start_codon:yes stop_codon:yes gene_type:complete
MLKIKGLTLVAVATLLAGFIASCSSEELPSSTDLSSPATTITVEVEDDLSK